MRIYVVLSYNTKPTASVLGAFSSLAEAKQFTKKRLQNAIEVFGLGKMNGRDSVCKWGFGYGINCWDDFDRCFDCVRQWSIQMSGYKQVYKICEVDYK